MNVNLNISVQNSDEMLAKVAKVKDLIDELDKAIKDLKYNCLTLEVTEENKADNAARSSIVRKKGGEARRCVY